MDISQMTYVSYFFAIMAVVFGTASAVMFFAYDIIRCWKIVNGRRVSLPCVKPSADRKKNHIAIAAQHGGVQKTERLCQTVHETAYKSTLLLAAEDTEPLETMCLVQDITLMEVQR